MLAHRRSFTVALTSISRVILLRDQIFGWSGIRHRGHHHPDLSVSSHSIPSGSSLLDAVFVEPAPVPARAAVLLCHGIGEIVDHWFPVQSLLAANGVASLLFDFSGYGRSTGRVDWSQFEEDAVSSFACLERSCPHAAFIAPGILVGQWHRRRDRQPRTGSPPGTLRSLYLVPRCRTLLRPSGQLLFCGSRHLDCGRVAARLLIACAHRAWGKGPPVSSGYGSRAGLPLRPRRGAGRRAQHGAQSALPQASPFLLGADRRVD